MHVLLSSFLAAWLLATGVPPSGAPGAAENFERTLEAWQIVGPSENVRIVPEPGAPANHVLELMPKEGGFVHALWSGAGSLTDLRLEGRLLFPTAGDGYLGLIYGYTRGEGRTDFGVLYVKGNGSYVSVSPHFDGNPSWRLYEEMRTALEGPQRIEPRRWYPFRLDVVGSEARLYFIDMETPVVRFDGVRFGAGPVGLEARPGRGDPVWVDDLQVGPLPADAAPLPPLRRDPVDPSLLTRWDVVGLAEQADPALEASDHRLLRTLATIEADQRGMIQSGRVTEYANGKRRVGYLRATLRGADPPRPMELVFSSANRLQLWLDGGALGSVAPDDHAWRDLLTNPERRLARVPFTLGPGEHTLLVRVEGDRFAGGGFYAALRPPSVDSGS